MDYSKQLGMIAEFLKPYCEDLKKGDVVVVNLGDYVTLSVSGGPACDIRISDRNPSYRSHKHYNEYTKWSANGIKDFAKKDYADGKHSSFLEAFREVPEYIARPLILNWREIKQDFIRKYEKRIAENKIIEAFEV